MAIKTAPFLKHSKDEFDTWLALDIEARDEFYELVGRELAVDVESLDALEAFLLKRYKSASAATEIDQRAVADAAARHFGMVLRLNVDDAAWGIDLERDENVYYRLPIIKFRGGEQECPLYSVLAAIDRRTSLELRTLATNFQEDYNRRPKKEAGLGSKKAGPKKKASPKAKKAPTRAKPPSSKRVRSRPSRRK